MVSTSMNQIIDKILKEEVHFHFAKSGGHGGQNVDKRNTKAELYFNVHDSNFLTPEQKQRLIVFAGDHMHHEAGILILTDQEERLQVANKEKVIHYFRQLLGQAIPEPKKRIVTKIPRYMKEERKEEKQIQSRKKQNRRTDALHASL
ncbi:MAG: aminoacyl-tRNA hydrolase [candidate division SR1 bacterium CG_4_9_14_3_um_filter_40_9]|nr:MAG: aminoacyl-tRNA hydrolase [candidate division SR1 bacterium CG_4_9_14_3_um_filter_40_9]